MANFQRQNINTDLLQSIHLPPTNYSIADANLYGSASNQSTIIKTSKAILKPSILRALIQSSHFLLT